MKNLNKAKEVYQSIHIPKHLSYVVNKAIGKNGKKEHHPWNLETNAIYNKLRIFGFCVYAKCKP